MRDTLIADARQFVSQFAQDDVFGLGAELAYRFLFAVFPFAIFVASLSAFAASALGFADPTQQIMSTFGNNLPSNIVGPVQSQLQEILGQNQPGLISFGGLLALYAAAGGTNALMKAMTRAYDVRETRPFPLRYAFAVLLTILAGLGIIASFVLVVGGTLLTQDLSNRFGIGNEAWTVLALVRLPIVFAILTFAVAVLFRYAPNIRPPWRWAILGAAAFAVAWLVATFAFAFYVSRFGGYTATYGTIAGVIVLMLWFYLTSIVLVSAAELVAVLIRRHEPELLEARRAEVGLASEAERELRRLLADAERTLRRGEQTAPAGPGREPPAPADAASSDEEADRGAPTAG